MLNDTINLELKKRIVCNLELKKRNFLKKDDVVFLNKLKYDENILPAPYSLVFKKEELKKTFSSIFELNNINSCIIKNLDSSDSVVFTEIRIFNLKREGNETDSIDVSKNLFNKIREIHKHKLWMPFVIQEHKKDNTTHKDLRLFIPKDFSKKIMSYENAREIFENNNLDGMVEGIAISEENDNIMFKHPQSKEWMFFEGLNKDGEYKILSNGIYSVSSFGENRIILVLKSSRNFSIEGYFRLYKDSNNKWKFVKFLRPGAMPKLNIEQMEEIYNLRKTCSIKHISKKLNLSMKTVYNYLEKMSSNHPV